MTVFQVSTLAGHAFPTPVAFHVWCGDREDDALTNLRIRVADDEDNSDSFAAEDGVTVGAADGGGGEFDKCLAILQLGDANLVYAEVAIAALDQDGGGAVAAGLGAEGFCSFAPSRTATNRESVT